MSQRHENSTGSISLPSEAYCVAWMDSLIGFLPQLASRQREIITRLAGWGSWQEMLAACHGGQGFNVSDHTVEQRLDRLSAQRSILIHEFGIKPAYANHFLWNNPLGSTHIFAFNQAGPAALYRANEKPSPELAQIIAELDQRNRAMFACTDEGGARACAFVDPGVHIGLCQFLGWELSVDTATPPIHGFVSADILGKVTTSELGAIEVYTTGLTRSPDDKIDEHFDLLLDWAATHQAAVQVPLIILYSQPMLRNLPQGPISIFGALVVEGNAWNLPLSAAAKNLADYLIDVMASPNLDAQPLFDTDFELARRFHFCKALVHDGITREEAQATIPVIYVEGSGWGKFNLKAS